MRPTLEAMQHFDAFDLSLIVTGMHLAQAYGLTVREIESSGLEIAERVPVPLEPRTGATMARNVGQMLIAFVTALERIRPDVVVVLGDRGEMLAGALAAIHLNIPIVHIHGGERSGTVDEPVRHAISKLSHYHFVATEESRRRLIRMGERADRIFVTGAPGLVGLKELARINRKTLAADAGLDAASPIALLVYHPVLQEMESAAEGTERVIRALAHEGVQVVALKSNSDAGGEMIDAVLASHASGRGMHLAPHFPRERFVSWMAAADLMIGNSSAGIIEAATFGTPVVNVGSRQNLRERNVNVRDVPAASEPLAAAIRNALAHGRYAPANVYGNGDTHKQVIALLRGIPLGAEVLAKSNAY
jgi:GDP/UDP-N,N'-diacetylbacillosamine 2-epimerase (hydrolysing)